MELMDMTLRDIYKAYYRNVRYIASELATLDEETRQDRLHELIDSNEWTIYTFRARLVCALSENNEAHIDVLGESEPVTVNAQAFYAMEQDVLDLLSNDYFLNDEIFKKESEV